MSGQGDESLARRLMLEQRPSISLTTAITAVSENVVSVLDKRQRLGIIYDIQRLYGFGGGIVISGIFEIFENISEHLLAHFLQTHHFQ